MWDSFFEELIKLAEEGKKDVKIWPYALGGAALGTGYAVHKTIPYYKATGKDLMTHAQALDNSSEDPLRLNGEQLRGSDVRQKAVYDSHKAMEGAKDVSEGVKVNGTKFQLHIMSNEKDVVGRGAPVVFHGDMPASDLDDWSSKLKGRMHSEFEALGRTVDPTKIESAVDALKSHHRKNMFRRLAGGVQRIFG